MEPLAHVLFACCSGCFSGVAALFRCDVGQLLRTASVARLRRGYIATVLYVLTQERADWLRAVLFATSFMLTLIPSARGPWLGIAMWAGVMCAVVAIWLATPTMRNDSNLWPVDLVVNGAMTGAPMLIGRTVGLVYWRVRAGQKLELWVVGAAIATLALAAWFYV